ncbi:MAG: glycosyltransferase family 4 protein [Gammaproteobacteria bacterium]|nr:glycosyltransferase family 4 protein [Gammaproteobacteria bacterium]
MRVLLASPATGAYGGMEEFVIALAQQLSVCRGFEVRACFKLVPGATVSDTLRAQLEQSGITFVLVPRASRELVSQLWWADLVHAQAASPDICLLTRLLGRKLVLTVHNHLHGQRGARARSWRAALRLAHRRWYNSQFVRASWERSAPSIASEAFPAVARVDRQFFPLEGRSGFVFGARMVPGKGAETLLEAYQAAQLDPVRWPLRLVGEGPLLGRLKERFASHPGVRFEGFVTQQCKDELIARARWLIAVPDYLEAMGVTPIEARRKAVPCIVSLDGGLPEVAGSEALTCAPGDALGLARCLATAAHMSDEDYERRARAAYEGVARLLRPLEWYADSYRSVLGRRDDTIAAPRAG